MSSNQSQTIASGILTTKPLMMTVQQKYWSWFKGTGRSFVITKDDGSIIFVVRSHLQGKHRTFEDSSGKPMFKLERNWTSKKRAWVLKSRNDLILTVDYSAVHRKVSMDVSFEKTSTSPHGNVHVQASDNAGGQLTVTSREAVLATLRCTNMTTGYFSSLMVTPPTWKVDMAVDVDVALISALAVCISDAFSENRFLML